MNRTTWQALLLTSVAASMLLIAGCRGADDSEAQRALEERDAMTQELQELRESRLQDLRSLSVPALVGELDGDSQRGVEPFNSMAYAEMISRGGAAVPELAAALASGETQSLLSLLALRQIGAAEYGGLDPSLRTGILVSALAASKTFNVWGLPHQYWEDAGQALIAEGKVALQMLRPLLDDCRNAPMWGSEEILASQEYGYRLCDYAWVMMHEIQGEKPEVPIDPATRDGLIGGLKAPQPEEE